MSYTAVHVHYTTIHVSCTALCVWQPSFAATHCMAADKKKKKAEPLWFCCSCFRVKRARRILQRVVLRIIYLLNMINNNKCAHSPRGDWHIGILCMLVSPFCYCTFPTECEFCCKLTSEARLSVTDGLIQTLDLEIWKLKLESRFRFMTLYELWAKHIWLWCHSGKVLRS